MCVCFLVRSNGIVRKELPRTAMMVSTRLDRRAPSQELGGLKEGRQVQKGPRDSVLSGYGWNILFYLYNQCTGNRCPGQQCWEPGSNGIVCVTEVHPHEGTDSDCMTKACSNGQAVFCHDPHLPSGFLHVSMQQKAIATPEAGSLLLHARK